MLCSWHCLWATSWLDTFIFLLSFIQACWSDLNRLCHPVWLGHWQKLILGYCLSAFILRSTFSTLDFSCLFRFWKRIIRWKAKIYIESREYLLWTMIFVDQVLFIGHELILHSSRILSMLQRSSYMLLLDQWQALFRFWWFVSCRIFLVQLNIRGLFHHPNCVILHFFSFVHIR